MLEINHALPAQSEQSDIVANTYPDYHESEYGCSQPPDDSMAAAYNEYSQTQSPDYSHSQFPSDSDPIGSTQLADYVPTQIAPASSTQKASGQEEQDESDDEYEPLLEERNNLHNSVGRNGFIHVYSVITEKYANNKTVMEGNILKHVFNKAKYTNQESIDRLENMVLKKDKKWYPKPWAQVSTRQKRDMEGMFFEEQTTFLRRTNDEFSCRCQHI
jgi:hypothetical protein